MHVDRFLNKIRLGVFESGMLFRYAPKSFPANNIAAEAGVEMSMVDLYGLTLSARVAPLYSYDILNTNWYQSQEWDTQDWLDHVVIYVSLNLDPYFR
ncbi:hypothetical protein BMS3Bbin04_01226 [bacterium BMS3Bbin04]|nr:hypothetical protein BMS3Bbin04_01226 [bacterium BMS3Bbin04]